MYDRQTHLFCFKSIKAPEALVFEGGSFRYTLMSLLGLHRHKNDSGGCFLDIGKETEYHLNKLFSLENGGDVGLLLWLIALVCPERCDTFFQALHDRDLVDGFSDTKQRRTMELAWILTGLSYGALNNPVFKKLWADIARRIFSLLKSNYGGKGIFRHQPSLSVKSWIHSMMGSFADQIYPIYAFSTYSSAFDDKEAADIALACAETICKLQGPLGQWWWHYNPADGTVAGRYPVYSVHQEGMAPMALFAISKLSGRDFLGPIYKGLDWITGKNELNFCMIDDTRHVVWRNIHRTNTIQRLEELFSVLGIHKSTKDISDLKMLPECWSYELGWLLYAFSGKSQ